MATSLSKNSNRTRVDDSDDASSRAKPCKGGRPKNRPIGPPHDNYTVAWICTLGMESRAAIAMLDRQHQNLPQQAGDDVNEYTLGNIGRHNIVIAAGPPGCQRTDDKAQMVVKLLCSFPSVKTGLMVGLGGGVPVAGAEMRLGDVAVGRAVMRHDLYDEGQDGASMRVATSLFPPDSLMSAIHKQESYSFMPSIFQETLDNYLNTAKYTKPDPSKDKLFHPTRASVLIKRHPRDGSGPKVHYGIIASGDGAVEDAVSRNKIAKELEAIHHSTVDRMEIDEVICIERGAAGAFTGTVGWLVIRGICDYSDSHKNDEWKEYATAAAAAYAKALLIESLTES